MFSQQIKMHSSFSFQIRIVNKYQTMFGFPQKRKLSHNLELTKLVVQLT